MGAILKIGRRSEWAKYCALFVALMSTRAEAQTPRTATAPFVAYANASSHILIGGSQDQRLLLLGADWVLIEHRGRFVEARWEVDVIPVAVLIGPFTQFTQVVTYNSGATPLPGLPPGTSSYSGPFVDKCFPESASGLLYPTTIAGNVRPIGSLSVMQTCAHTATYGGGLSPLGQRFVIAAAARVHPYVVGNAGFLTFTRNVPDDSATRFNFTFEFGAGIEWKRGARRAWSLDARVHHTSNAFRGNDNPGIDNVIFRLSYTKAGGWR